MGRGGEASFYSFFPFATLRHIIVLKMGALTIEAMLAFDDFIHWYMDESGSFHLGEMADEGRGAGRGEGERNLRIN